MGIKGIALSAALALGTMAAAAPTYATTIDFTALPGGTPVSSLDGVTFSMHGGPSTSTVPATNTYGGAEAGLQNSSNSGYPTNSYLDATFGGPVTGVSFTFNNEDDNSYFADGGSTYTAFNAAGGVVSTGSLATAGGEFGDHLDSFTVAGSGISTLEFFNGRTPGVDQGDGSASWIFNVGQISFTSQAVAAAPEPATWMMMILGFGLVGGVMRRAYRKSEENFTRTVRSIATA